MEATCIHPVGPSSAANFHYEPLTRPDLARILHLQPSNGRLECSLSVFSLPSSGFGDYTALSYTWNPEYPRKTIWVNGKALQIGKTLWETLQRIAQRLKSSLALWVDAICINQADNAEKSSQVKLMGRIYARACNVVLCLNGYEEEALVVENFRLTLLNASREGIFDYDEFWRKMEPPKLKWMDPNILQAALQSFDCLCRHEYWSRLWIVQELVLAQDTRLYVQCGRFWWDYPFWRAMIQLAAYDGGRHWSWDRSPASHIAFLVMAFGAKDVFNDWGLSMLLTSTKHSLCRDRKDRVFGLLGMTDVGEQFDIDYDDTEQRVYEKTLELYGPQTELTSVPQLESLLRNCLGIGQSKAQE